MNMLSFIVVGDVRGKGRPRFARINNGVKTYTDSKTASYEQLIQLYARQACMQPIKTACSVTILVQVAIPASWSDKKRQQALNGDIQPTVKPDTDNIAKVILDALNGITFDDDKQVTQLTVKKVYAETALARIEIFY